MALNGYKWLVFLSYLVISEPLTFDPKLAWAIRVALYAHLLDMGQPTVTNCSKSNLLNFKNFNFCKVCRISTGCSIFHTYISYFCRRLLGFSLESDPRRSSWLIDKGFMACENANVDLSAEPTAFDQAFQLLHKCFWLGVIGTEATNSNSWFGHFWLRLQLEGLRQKTHVCSTKLLQVAFCTPIVLPITCLSWLFLVFLVFLVFPSPSPCRPGKNSDSADESLHAVGSPVRSSHRQPSNSRATNDNPEPSQTSCGFRWNHPWHQNGHSQIFTNTWSAWSVYCVLSTIKLCSLSICTARGLGFSWRAMSHMESKGLS